MRILHLGYRSGTSIQRARALERLGHEVTIVNPDRHVADHKLIKRFHYAFGGILSEKRVTRRALQEIDQLGDGANFDFVWSDSGRYVGPSLVKALKDRYGKVVNYNHDDPFGGRDGNSWNLYKKAVPHYDLLAVVRALNVPEVKAAGAKDVILVQMVADEVDHRPRELTPDDFEKWGSEVAFTGVWFPERGPFMAELLAQGIPLTLRGNRWQKAPEWPTLQKAWRGAVLKDPEEYSRSLLCAKVALGLLSKGNRDLHTSRSNEIPAMGGLFCAERTSEHMAMYEDGVEAVFWGDAKECAKVCKELLADDARRESIRKAGAARVRKNKAFNEPMMKSVIDRALGLS